MDDGGRRELRRPLLAMAVIQSVSSIGALIVVLLFFPAEPGWPGVVRWAFVVAFVMFLLHALIFLLPKALRERPREPRPGDRSG
ncbi:MULTISPECIES: hypothetical protein [Brevibacterium]|nr:hypothetical protein [Brevibacterium sp. CS2]QCP06267.1 hypothetical protein FDF13_14060 [Brevibacterium sp. CS2]